VQPLLVIDGDSLGHRSYHAMPSVEGAGGRPVGLLVGFAIVLLATVRATQPRAVIVCMDTRMPSYRHEILPAYQGQRDPFAEDLTEQLDRIPELAEAFGYAAAKLEPWEADDLLATSVALEEARGGGALVLSSDRDTYQLVSDATATLHPRPRGALERVDRTGVRELYGIEPEQVTSLIALRGDPSDNIPGAKGIGAKGAAELLRRYGDLEGVIAHAGELTPRQRAAVEGAADELRGYRAVATMRRDLPITVPDDAELDARSAAAWCREAGMLRLASRLTA
jgi:DNA polymerase-1